MVVSAVRNSTESVDIALDRVVSAVTNDETVVAAEVDVVTSVADNSFSVDGVVTAGEIAAVEDFAVVTSSEDVVVD